MGVWSVEWGLELGSGVLHGVWPFGNLECGVGFGVGKWGAAWVYGRLGCVALHSVIELQLLCMTFMSHRRMCGTPPPCRPAGL